MLVVSNTSPLSNLAIVGRLHLRERYGRVLLPPKVREELAALSHTDGRNALDAAFADGWLVVEPLNDRSLLARFEERVDPGEAEAMCLAEALHADKLLIALATVFPSDASEHL